MRNQSQRRESVYQKQQQVNMKGNYYQDMTKLVQLLPELMKEEIHMVAIRSLLMIARIDQTVLS